MTNTLKDYDSVKQVISANFPQQMTYVKADIKTRKGKYKRTVRRLQGASEDRLFSFMIYGSKLRIGRIEFMISGDPVSLVHGLVAVKAIIKTRYPDWDRGAWLTEQVRSLEDNTGNTLDRIKITRLDVYNNKVIFIDVA